MRNVEVLVVPETDDFIRFVSHENIIWTNGKLGRPNIEGHNARYIAPYWLHQKIRGVTRVYHIIGEPKVNDDESWEFAIGNSFILASPWIRLDENGQVRRFQYQRLSAFGLFEVKESILAPIKKLNLLQEINTLSGNTPVIPFKHKITTATIDGEDYYYIYLNETEKEHSSEVIKIQRKDIVELLFGR